MSAGINPEGPKSSDKGGFGILIYLENIEFGVVERVFRLFLEQAQHGAQQVGNYQRQGSEHIGAESGTGRKPEKKDRRDHRGSKNYA